MEVHFTPSALAGGYSLFIEMCTAVWRYTLLPLHWLVDIVFLLKCVLRYGGTLYSLCTGWWI